MRISQDIRGMTHLHELYNRWIQSPPLFLALSTKICNQEINLKTTLIVRNKWEKCEHTGKAIFDVPFMLQTHAESMKKILGPI